LVIAVNGRWSPTKLFLLEPRLPFYGSGDRLSFLIINELREMDSASYGKSSELLLFAAISFLVDVIFFATPLPLLIAVD
jgi:hypothetical protein